MEECSNFTECTIAHCEFGAYGKSGSVGCNCDIFCHTLDSVRMACVASRIFGIFCLRWMSSLPVLFVGFLELNCDEFCLRVDGRCNQFMMQLFLQQTSSGAKAFLL